MKKRTRNILIIVGIVCLMIFGIVGYGIYSVYSFMSRIGVMEEVEIPSELKESRIVSGDGFLSKTEMFSLSKDEFFETVSKGSQIKSEKERQKYISSQSARKVYGFEDIKTCGSEIIAVGKFGGFGFDLNGKLQREILFEPKVTKITVLGFEKETYQDALDKLKIYDFEGDGKCEFVSYSSVDGVSFFDDQGNATWRYGEQNIALGDVWKEQSEEERKKESYITGVFVGDLNNDGISEFLIAKKNDGIRAYDINKKELWFQPDKYPTADFKILDVDGDGKNDIVELQGQSSIIRNAGTGEIIRELELDGGTEDILIAENNEGKKSAQTFRIDENKIIVSDLENKVLWESDASLSEIKNTNATPSSTPIDVGNGMRIEPVSSFNDTTSVYEPKASYVRLRKDKPKFLAVIASFISIPRSNLYVYDERGNLVYQELLPEDAETIAVMPADNGAEDILIGGKDTIWRFGAK